MHASDLEDLDVAIIGAGYAGAAAGRALGRLGCNVRIYEQAGQDPRGRRRHRPPSFDDGSVLAVGDLRRARGA